MARFNLKNLQEKRDVIAAKKSKAKQQSAKVMPATTTKKPRRGCGCGRRRKST